MKKRMTQNQFLEKAFAKHGSEYDYSQAIYSSCYEVVTIICRRHGAFEQRAYAHISGSGCLKCRSLERPDTALRNKFTRSTTQVFVEKAQARHGLGAYDYSRVVYAGSGSKVEIICPSHGLFMQHAGSHLRGHKCPRCAFLATGGARSLGKNLFVQRAQAKHGVGTYDYSHVVYVNSISKVEIGCPVHGLFMQLPQDHSRGMGCRKCAYDKLRELARSHWIDRAQGRPAILYFLRLFDNAENFYKVGVTFHSIDKRYNRVALAGYQYEILAQHISTNAAAVYDWEQSILETFSHISYQPKQCFGGATECFSSAEEILAIFPL